MFGLINFQRSTARQNCDVLQESPRDINRAIRSEIFFYFRIYAQTKFNFK